jgi:hypothetical protein
MNCGDKRWYYTEHYQMGEEFVSVEKCHLPCILQWCVLETAAAPVSCNSNKLCPYFVDKSVDGIEAVIEFSL